MKFLPTAALALTLTMAMPVGAADQPAKKNWWWPFKKEEAKPTPAPTKKAPAAKQTSLKTAKSRSVPPKSKMIVIPPTTGDAAPPELISSEMSGKDLVFFTAAVEAGRWQEYLVGMLRTHARSDQIQTLGKALAETQEAENRQIARLASLKGWQVSTQPTAAQKKAGAELEKLAGADFDKAAMDKLIVASRQAVAAYEAAGQSSDADIQTFAGQMLSVAQDKLRLAEKLTGAGRAAAKLFRTNIPGNPSTETMPENSKPEAGK